MLEHLERLLVEAKKACDAIKAYNGTLRVVSHYDADGITSAAIFLKALARAGKRFHLTFVKQLEEPVVRGLAVPEFVVFLDLGSGQLEWIGKYLSGAFKVVVIDHHQPQGIAGKNVIHVNPLLFGIEENVSGAGMCYLMARTLSPENRDLSELAIVGAIADSQQGGEREWGLQGLNREIMKDAQETGKIIVTKGLRIWGKRGRPLHKALEYCAEPAIPGVTGTESGAVQFLQELGIPLKRENGEWRTLSDLTEEEQKRLAGDIIKVRVQGGEENPDWIFGDVVELPDKGRLGDANELATLINATGKRSKPFVGVSVCWNDQGAQEEAEKILDAYRREIGKAVRLLEGKSIMAKRKSGYYALCGTDISEDVLSNVISLLHKSAYTAWPVFGFAAAREGKVKISARVSDSLVEKGVNLKEIVSTAAQQVGGEGGGHAGAAGGMIPAGSEEAFISLTENILSGLGITSNGVAEPPEIYGREKTSQGGGGEEGSGKAGGSEGTGGNNGTNQNRDADPNRPGSSEGGKDSDGEKGLQGREAGRREERESGGGEKRAVTGGNRTAVNVTEGGKDSSGKKVERKGLVCYFGAAAV